MIVSFSVPLRQLVSVVLSTEVFDELKELHARILEEWQIRQSCWSWYSLGKVRFFEYLLVALSTRA